MNYSLFFVIFSIAHLWLQKAEGTRQIKFINNCPTPLWVSPRSNPDSKSVIPVTDIRKLAVRGSTVYTIADPGFAGRFWPKFGCDNGGQNCKIGQSEPPCPTTGCTLPAETLVEFYFGRKGDTSGSGENFYDISLVDGYSTSVQIVPSRKSGGSCIDTKCNLNINNCPTNENDGIGSLVLPGTKQCLAPCKKYTANRPAGLGQSKCTATGLAYCCPTDPSNSNPTCSKSVEQCRSGAVVRSKYVAYIRQSCPTAYSYAYDDVNALHKCANDVGFDVTYCP